MVCICFDEPMMLKYSVRVASRLRMDSVSVISSWRSSARPTSGISTSKSKGFSRNQKAPAFVASTARSTDP
jgi:hypothetical protein